MIKLSIIIPAYNEEKRIKNTLEAYSSFFERVNKNKVISTEIIVVLNACRDGTLDIVKNTQKKFGIIKYLNLEQGGKGFAILEGFKESLKSGSDLIGFVDADMATSPEAFYNLVENLNGYEGIIASRYVPGAIVNPKQSFQRIVASRVFNFMTRSLLFLKFKDTQCGAKLFKKRVVERIVNKIGITKWAFDVNLLYEIKKNKFKILEHPTVWVDKEYSKINLKRAGPQMVSAILRLRLINSHFKFVVRAYDKIPEFLKIKL